MSSPEPRMEVEQKPVLVGNTNEQVIIDDAFKDI
jgi:hypothetical protein